LKKLKQKIKELEAKVKEFEKKYVDTKMLLSRAQMQNHDLEREVWELKNKLNHQSKS
jgi:BMFP domain-containing protein YqiC